MHIVHGELRKAPYVKQGCGQDGQSTMFIIELSEVVKDRQTGEKNYTNYSAAIFAKSPAQIDYYNTSLVEGNFVVVNCERLKIDVNISKNDGRQHIKLQMEGARLEGAKYIESNQQAQGGFQQQAPQQNQGYQAPQQQQAPVNQFNGQQNPPRDAGGFTQAQGGFQQQAPQQQGGYQQPGK